jgi:hypothetical protein
MLSRLDVIGRLTTIADVACELLADPNSDKQYSLEQTHRYLETLIRRLRADEEQDTKPAASALGLLLDFEIATRNPRADKACETCGGCPAGPGCIGALILDDHKACTCPPKTAPVAAQTI